MRIATITCSIAVVAGALTVAGTLPAHANAPSSYGADTAPAAVRAPAPPVAPAPVPAPAVAAARDGNAMVALAMQYVGVVPYSAGASPENGFMCDGLTQWVYGQFGVDLPRGVTAQASRGVEVSAAEAQAGDLVVYPGEHIGIYDGAGGIIDSPDWGRYVSHRAIWGNPIFVHIP
ncbi:C40 family peptidase [Leifsonia sp. LS-T14]|uniref:C40 family peptidase n=1 Tax=unclassified Leifsonia TaxID=2663824 RepID=UPI0035A6D3AF